MINPDDHFTTRWAARYFIYFIIILLYSSPGPRTRGFLYWGYLRSCKRFTIYFAPRSPHRRIFFSPLAYCRPTLFILTGPIRKPPNNAVMRAPYDEFRHRKLRTTYTRIRLRRFSLLYTCTYLPTYPLTPSCTHTHTRARVLLLKTLRQGEGGPSRHHRGNAAYKSQPKTRYW